MKITVKSAMTFSAVTILVGLILIGLQFRPILPKQASNRSVIASTAETDHPSASSIGISVEGPSSYPSPEIIATYIITYQKDGFQVRERLLGQIENWEWDSFTMPNLRIHDPNPDLGFDKPYPEEKYERCVEQIEVTGWCKENVEFTTSDGKDSSFSLAKNHITMGGDYRLAKNNQVLWESRLQASTYGPIISSKRIGDEIAIEYLDISNSKSGNYIHSILITCQNSVIDLKNTTGYDAVFAPNEVDKRLIYFAKEILPKATTFLVYDGKVVAEYDSVFDLKCCYDGPPIQVIGNGKIIDFFAKKNGGWYHVQAGYFDATVGTTKNMP